MAKKILLRNSLRKNLLAGFLGIFLSLILLELCCQIYTIHLSKQWEAIKAAPNHYFKASQNVALGYELASNFSLEKDNRRLWINRLGIREQENEINAKAKLAILGDSVVFGTGFSQEQTISSLLQESLNRGGAIVKVLNFGVPGYGLIELAEYLKIKNDIYDVDHVIYILNLNDFSWRDSIYEGADAGVYRMYHLPLIKSPWFIKKAIYRLIKYRGLDDYRKDKASVKWYQWLFKGNKDAGYKQIREMAFYLREKGSGFTVVLLPVGVAYSEQGSYKLTAIHKEIGAFLKANHINYISPTQNFGSSVGKYFDPTDHLTFEGNVLMVEILLSYLEKS